MGTFGGYTGSMSISDKKKKEFTKNLLKLLNYGGMMQLDKVCMYGKEIGFLTEKHTRLSVFCPL